jgi:hypothetical protein
MSEILIRLAASGESDTIGELREAAYRHDYGISEGYRQGLRDVAAQAAGREVGDGARL